MSQQGYVAAPPYSQAQPGMGGYQGGFGAGPAQPLYGHYGGPPQAFNAPPAGEGLRHLCLDCFSNNMGFHFTSSVLPPCKIYSFISEWKSSQAFGDDSLLFSADIKIIIIVIITGMLFRIRLVTCLRLFYIIMFYLSWCERVNFLSLCCIKSLYLEWCSENYRYILLTHYSLQVWWNHQFPLLPACLHLQCPVSTIQMSSRTAHTHRGNNLHKRASVSTANFVFGINIRRYWKWKCHFWNTQRKRQMMKQRRPLWFFLNSLLSKNYFSNQQGLDAKYILSPYRQNFILHC